MGFAFFSLSKPRAFLFDLFFSISFDSRERLFPFRFSLPGERLSSFKVVLVQHFILIDSRRFILSTSAAAEHLVEEDLEEDDLAAIWVCLMNVVYICSVVCANWLFV